MIARAVLRELNEARRDRYASMFNKLSATLREAENVVRGFGEVGQKVSTELNATNNISRMHYDSTPKSDSFQKTLSDFMLYNKDDRIVYGLKHHIGKEYKKLSNLLHYAVKNIESEEGSNSEDYVKCKNLYDRVRREYSDWVQKKMGYRSISDFVSSGGLFFANLLHYLSLPIPEIQNTVLLYQRYDDLVRDFGTLEERWQSEGKRFIPDSSVSDAVETLVDFGDGWVWVNLNENGCRAEANAMGHCSTGAHPGDINFSLRERVSRGSVSGWRPHMTFIWNERTGCLNEMKGVNNQKPDREYNERIISLLRHKKVRGINYNHRGYRPQMDFDPITDLEPSVAESLLQERPELFRVETMLERDVSMTHVIDSIQSDSELINSKKVLGLGLLPDDDPDRDDYLMAKIQVGESLSLYDVLKNVVGIDFSLLVPAQERKIEDLDDIRTDYYYPSLFFRSYTEDLDMLRVVIEEAIRRYGDRFIAFLHESISRYYVTENEPDYEEVLNKLVSKKGVSERGQLVIAEMSRSSKRQPLGIIERVFRQCCARFYVKESKEITAGLMQYLLNFRYSGGTLSFLISREKFSDLYARFKNKILSGDATVFRTADLGVGFVPDEEIGSVEVLKSDIPEIMNLFRAEFEQLEGSYPEAIRKQIFG